MLNVRDENNDCDDCDTPPLRYATNRTQCDLFGTVQQIGHSVTNMAYIYKTEDVFTDDIRFEMKTLYRHLIVVRVDACVYSVMQKVEAGWHEMQVCDSLTEARMWAFKQL